MNLAVHNDEASQSDGLQTTSYQVCHYISTKQGVKCLRVMNDNRVFILLDDRLKDILEWKATQQ